MFKNYQFMSTLIFLIFIETIAMGLVEYSIKNNNYYYIISIILYSFIPLLFYVIIKNSIYNSSNINAIWNSSTTILLFAFGIIYFKNDINLYGIIGIIFALLSIYFINYN